jgi:hypothetical protein
MTVASDFSEHGRFEIPEKSRGGITDVAEVDGNSHIEIPY